MDHTSSLALALSQYISEIESAKQNCARFDSCAAIHTKGSHLQLYRILDANREIADHIHAVSSSLPSWEEMPDWKKQKTTLNKLQQEVIYRVTNHSKQNEVVTKGVLFKDRPTLIHVYKFEPDPVLKIELVQPKLARQSEELPLVYISRLLEVHDILAPQPLFKARRPYSHHEVDFLTIDEYLSKEMPDGLYASMSSP